MYNGYIQLCIAIACQTAKSFGVLIDWLVRDVGGFDLPNKSETSGRTRKADQEHSVRAVSPSISVFSG